MVEPSEILMEIREEIMVSAKGGEPTSKTSHFIKPMLKKNEKTPELPTISLSFRPVLQSCTFNGWSASTREWVSWVDHMYSLHKSVWKKAGICEAILSSKYKVIRNEELLLGLAERWCSVTNTFVFPWGEATLTLEDVNVLGGFSVLGNSVYGSVSNNYVAEIEEQLLGVYENLRRGAVSDVVSQNMWMKRFRKSGSKLEHEAFLSLWLSRFVLPCFPCDSIVPKFFKVAVCLAKGIEIAIAPVVLASIYKDLTLLKSSMLNDDKVDDFGREDLLMVTLWAPLQWVQVWAWERFPEFRPKPEKIAFGEPRLARWHNLEQPEIGNVRRMLQSAWVNFEWRPYCKCVDDLPLPGFYRGEERWIFMGEDSSKEVKIMAHCLRVTELVGIESIEQYNPHRLAMQFGFDQDLPQFVKRDLVDSGIPQRELEQLAWLGYADPVRDQLLYLPSMSYEPQVTVRYLKWLREGSLTRRAALEGGIATRKRNSFRLRRLKPPRLLFEHDETNVPPTWRTREVIDLDIDEDSDVEPYCSGNSSLVPRRRTRKVIDLDIDEESDVEQDCRGTSLVPRSRTRKVIGLDIDEESEVEPNFSGNDLDLPLMFTPDSYVAKKKSFVPTRCGLNKATALGIDVPPGFVPKSMSTDLDVHTPVNLAAGRKDGSVFNPVVMIAKECIKSIGDDQTLLKSTDLGKHFEVESNRTIGHGTDVPPGFMPKSIHLDAPPGFPAKFSEAKKADAGVPPGFMPKGTGNEQNVPPGFPPKFSEVKKVDASVPPLGFMPKGTENEQNVPPGFPPKFSEANKADAGVPPGFMPKRTENERIVPPGFPPQFSEADKADAGVPPGFMPKRTENERIVPPGFPPQFSEADKADAGVPPGFMPKRTGNEQNVPPGFPAKGHSPMKLPKVKEECSVKSNQTLLKSGCLTDNNLPADIGLNEVNKSKIAAEKYSGRSNQVLTGYDVGSEQVRRQVSPTVTNGSSRQPHGSERMDVDTHTTNVLEPTIKVKKERIETVGQGQTLLNSSYQTAPNLTVDMGPNQVKKSTALAGKFSGTDLEHRDIAPVATHGNARLNVVARVTQLEKIISALKETI